MKLNDLKPAPGAKKSRRRVGRGLGSGRGKTAGRGQKGQSSRSGFSQGSGWEGGRSRLIMRLPKRGFTHQGIEYQIVNLRDLNDFEEGSTINSDTLRAAGVIRHANRPVKLLGDGELTVRNLQLELDAYSRGAVNAVQAAGGSLAGVEAGSDESSDTAEQDEPQVTQDTNAAESANQEVNAGQEVDESREDVQADSSEADQEVDVSETVIKTGNGSVRITEEPAEDEVGADTDEEQA